MSSDSLEYIMHSIKIRDVSSLKLFTELNLCNGNCRILALKCEICSYGTKGFHTQAAQTTEPPAALTHKCIHTLIHKLTVYYTAHLGSLQDPTYDQNL